MSECYECGCPLDDLSSICEPCDDKEVDDMARQAIHLCGVCPPEAARVADDENEFGTPLCQMHMTFAG